MQRRVFVRDGALALVTMGLSPSFLRRATLCGRAAGGAQGKDPGLPVPARRRRRTEHDRAPRRARVLRGAAEHRHSAPAIGRAMMRRIDLDGFFGLHPALRPFERLYRDGLLAPIHAVGSPSATRSHFDAQDYMESGTPDRKSTQDGWLNRYLAVKGTCEECASAEASPFRAVSHDAADAAHP